MEPENKTENEQTEKKPSGVSADRLKELVTEAIGGALSGIDERVNAAVKAQIESVAKTPASNMSAYIIPSRNPEDEPRPDPQEKGIAASRMVRALAFGKGDTDRALYFCEKSGWGDKMGDRVQKALAAGDFTAGGFMVPEDMAADIIDLLRPRSVVRAAGAPTIPMPNGTFTMPKQTGDITANYVGENQNITKTEPTGGDIVMSAKKLAAIVPMSNELLMFDRGTQADMFVRNSLVRRIAVREDQAFLRDDGTSNKPRGIRYWAQNGNIFASAGTSAANVESDFKDAIQKLEGNNVDMTNPVWFMAPRSKNHLITLRDANGNLIYPEMRSANPTIHTYPVFVSNNVPTNLGGGGNETELYLVNMPDTLIGEAGGMEIEVSSEASYVEGSSLVSAFSRDQTVLRAITRHDFAMTYAESAAVVTGITWGA